MILKKEGAEDLKDFRPISLVGSFYKIIAKVLANRLKKVLNRLLSKAQNAFVEGRQYAMEKRKEKGILCKLDIEKAYDQINWNFILMLLLEMGFGTKWISWIRWCISTAFARYSLMVAWWVTLEAQGA